MLAGAAVGLLDGAPTAVSAELLEELEDADAAAAPFEPVRVPPATGLIAEAPPAELTARLPPAVGNAAVAPVDTIELIEGAVVPEDPVEVEEAVVAETVAGIDVVAPVTLLALM